MNPKQELTSLQAADQPIVVGWLQDYLQDHLAWWSTALHLGWSEADIGRHIDQHKLATKTWNKLWQAAPLSQALVLILREQQQAIGIIHAGVELDDLLGTRIGQIHWIYVAEGKRRFGNGRLLMQKAQRWLASKKTLAVTLSVNRINSPAKSFYEEMGFRVSDQRMLLTW